MPSLRVPLSDEYFNKLVDISKNTGLTKAEVIRGLIDLAANHEMKFTKERVKVHIPEIIEEMTVR